ncbi:MAG TPA: hypothetical protein VKX16_15535 [Chloroflexota bacterium]|nr:hypothetical protein [Chloroflexota bacterium]
MLARGHWNIERQHWLQDVVFREDASPVRTSTAPQLLAALRIVVPTLLRRNDSTAIAAAHRTFAVRPSHAFALVVHSFLAYR